MSKAFSDTENSKQFEERKKSHLKLALNERNEASGLAGFDHLQLIHEALPELNFEDIRIHSQAFGKELKAPFIISSMTAGHSEGVPFNLMFARQAAERGWIFAVGSQRRELTDSALVKEWKDIRKQVPHFIALGNIGISQLIKTPIDQVKELAEGLEATAMIVHLNALQEVIQLEGTPQFKGGLAAIADMVKSLGIPVVVKETGCGFSQATLKRLTETGIAAVDVGGFGGTHWGRIEGERAEEQSDRAAQIRAKASESFANWGISTTQSVMNAVELKANFEVWGSGGVRSGLDAAKLFALGAQKVGFAKPLLVAAMKGEESLSLAMETLEYELKTSMFCTGLQEMNGFHAKKVWTWA